MNALPRRILVPVDFEKTSRRTIRYAKAFAAASQGEICLLHVMPMAAGCTPTASDQWWLRLAERTLAGVVERTRLAPGTRTCVLAGPVAPTIAAYAHDNDFDLVIMTGRSRPDWQGSLLGSTATAMLRHSRVPILVVPGRARRADRPEQAPGALPVPVESVPRATERRRARSCAP